jgi:hypothetical protein
MRDCGSRISDCGLGATGLLLLALCAFLCTGCAKRQSTMGRAPEVNPPPAVERSAEVRSDELGELSRRFSETAQSVSGTAQQHRRGMQQVFAELAKILPVLYGPNPRGTFRQQIRIVENARSQLASAPQSLAVEPTIDTALRSARDALASLASRTYFDQAQLGQSMDRLDASIAALDAARGASHQEVAAESVEAMARVIQQMSDAMTRRVDAGAGDGAAPPTQPAPDR